MSRLKCTSVPRKSDADDGSCRIMKGNPLVIFDLRMTIDDLGNLRAGARERRSVSDGGGWSCSQDQLESEAQFSKTRCDDQGKASGVTLCRVDCFDSQTPLCLLALRATLTRCPIGFTARFACALPGAVDRFAESSKVLLSCWLPSFVHGKRMGNGFDEPGGYFIETRVPKMRKMKMVTIRSLTRESEVGRMGA